MTRLLIVIGCVFLAGGVLLGFAPQHVDGVSCGSVLHASNAAQVADLVTSFNGEVGDTSTRCDDRRSAYRPLVLLLLGLGAASLVGAALVRRPVTAPSSPR